MVLRVKCLIIIPKGLEHKSTRLEPFPGVKPAGISGPPAHSLPAVPSISPGLSNSEHAVILERRAVRFLPASILFRGLRARVFPAWRSWKYPARGIWGGAAQARLLAGLPRCRVLRQQAPM